MTYSYLFDNNLYRQLTTSPNGEALKNFNKSIDQVEIIKNIASSSVAFRMTPFTIMEALGISAPNPSIKLPNNLVRKKEADPLIDYVLSEAKAFYHSSPIIKREHFLEKAREQSKYTSYEAGEFERICIFDPLNNEQFELYFVYCLAFDYICKYDFPKDIQLAIMHKFLIPSFLVSHDLTSGLSKFRIAKKLWDIAYPQLLVKSDYPKETVEEMNSSMRLKKAKDFLDCELIHMVSLGDSVKNSVRPVVAFTCDDGQTIINRIMTYKSIIELLINLLNDEAFESYTETINSWQQGIVVFCNLDGTFKGVAEVDKIHPFK